MRVVEVIRVSESGGRDGDSFISPLDQRKRCAAWRTQHDAHLVRTFEEIDVSAGLPFAKRKGLRPAVELIEAGQADTLLFAYFDRSFRNVEVQMQALARIYRAGGKTFAADFGEIRIDTPASWFSTIVQGAANELGRLQTGYKTMNAKREAIARGVPVFSRWCRGYRRGADGRLEIDPVEGPLIAEAFRRRADGATIEACRDWLAERGVKLSYSSMKATFRSRHALGELHAGELHNAQAHEPLVDRLTWQRVQRMKSPRGRKPRNDIPGGLLARMQLLRCLSCGHAMVLSWTTTNGKHYRYYQCGFKPDCPRPVTIGAQGLEDIVIEEVSWRLADRSQSVSLDDQVRATEDELLRRQDELDAVIGALQGITAASARQKLLELNERVTEASDTLLRLRQASGPSLLVSAGRDWAVLSLEEQRS
ncbi:MAG TPA: recombinase family protein, partial [Chloroflexota bacterium]|nr:recombinase family protein [Chloroflexota bacterium]